MDQIASLWWLWLIGAIVTMLYGGYNQIQRMNRMMALESDNGMFKGMYGFLLAAILNLGFSVLLVTAIVLNVIDYAKR